MIRIVFALTAYVLSSWAWAAPSAEVCSMFPGPAQTHLQTYGGGNKKNGTLFINASGQIQGTKNYQVGFHDINVVDGTQVGPKTCYFEGQAQKCVPEPTLKAPNIALPTFEATNGQKEVQKDTIETETDNGYLDPLKVKKLTINGVSVTLRRGTYWIDALETTAAANVAPEIIIEKGEPVVIHLKSMALNGNASFNNQGSADNLVIIGHDPASSLEIQSKSETKSLVYNAGEVVISGEGTTLYGAVTANHVVVYGNTKIIGESQCFSMPKYQLDISPKSDEVTGCDLIPVTFSIVDERGVLQDKVNGTLDVSLTAPNMHGCLVTEPTAHCVHKSQSVALKNGQVTLWLGGTQSYIYIEGTLRSVNPDLTLTSTAGPFNFLKKGLRLNDGLPLKLVAGKKESVKVQVAEIQGNSRNCNISVPEEGLMEASVEYIAPTTGTRKLLINGTPIDVQRSYAVENIIDSRKPSEPDVFFDLNYFDAGKVKLTIRMPNPSSKSGYSSDDKFGEASATNEHHQSSNPWARPDEPNELVGSLTIDARPYTLAICDLQGGGHSDQSDAFTEAGRPFNALLKPVVWQNNDLNDESVVTLNDSFCGRMITPNFSATGSPSALLGLDSTAKVVTPAAAVGGEDAVLSGGDAIPNTTHTNGFFRFSNLAVSDVGRFELTSKSAASYLGMNINPAKLSVGRFYPSHFALNKAQSYVLPEIPATYDSQGRGFTYLEQPFDGNYTINAMTADNQAVRNYHLMDDAYKAEFADWVINPFSTNPVYGDDLSERWVRPAISPWKAGGGGVSEVAFDGEGRMAIQKGLSPDGPFKPLHFAVGVSKKDADGTNFKFCVDENDTGCETQVIKPMSGGNSSMVGAEFAKGEFLFGRMRLEGFTETQNLSEAQTMPVVVEYFDGQRFVTNSRDNASQVSLSVGQKDLLFSDKCKVGNDVQPSDCALDAEVGLTSDPKTVENGRSEFIVTAPLQNQGLNREQFRYWQKLSEGALPQPWLQYNWNGSEFDDDPSAIGTFGLYRGSDRVIYKGEKNITLTGE